MKTQREVTPQEMTNLTNAARKMCTHETGALKLTLAAGRFIEGKTLGELTNDKRVAAAVLTLLSKAGIE